MSEISLLEFVAKWSRAEWEVESNYLELRHMLDARIRRAEAAEKAMESWLAWCDSGNVEGTWDAYMQALANYKAAKEAVCKLEETT